MSSMVSIPQAAQRMLQQRQAVLESLRLINEMLDQRLIDQCAAQFNGLRDRFRGRFPLHFRDQVHSGIHPLREFVQTLRNRLKTHSA